MHLLKAGLALALAGSALARVVPVRRADDGLQTIVTYDNQSFSINGERIFLFSGEFHPYRLPVPSLWLDIFQKVKALGFSCVSFYADWALMEGEPGKYYDQDIWDYQPFADAAKQAGIYLLARPGPYINAEVSGGGFPGWLQRTNATVRTREPGYWNASMNYFHNINNFIAKNQITKGGPIILYQPENEYSYSYFDPQYMQDIMDVARKDGIVVPFISNDMSPKGHDAPGSGVGAVDVYGHDSYPLGFDCAHPTNWGNGFPTNFRTTHLKQSPSTPYSIVEFQGGSYDPWGGPGFGQCAAYTNEEFVRVWYKNNIAAGVTFFNVYMIYGGTNWGNLGYPQGYTSYDYGAAISEGRGVDRAKYSEMKLLANFLKVSPTYLDAVPAKSSSRSIANTADISVTPIVSRKSNSAFWVVRHTDATSTKNTNYKLTLHTSRGKITVPQQGGKLSLFGRDSKIVVSDYPVGNANLLYSTAEVFTWKKFYNSTVLVLYGEKGEHHELSFATNSSSQQVSTAGTSAHATTSGHQAIVSWDVTTDRQIIEIGDLTVLLVDRQAAYNSWVPQLTTPRTRTTYTTKQNVRDSMIVNAGYLVRSAALKGSRLEIEADFNSTTKVEVIGAPQKARTLRINGVDVPHSVDKHGFWQATFNYKAPTIDLPDMETLDWKYIDSLPEISASYDDSNWRTADITHSNNTQVKLSMPVSLYSSDYGYNTGYLIFRGHFNANGKEDSFFIHTQGGDKFASSVWLNKTLLGAWQGDSDGSKNLTLTNLQAGKNYVFTVIVENNGIEEAGVKSGSFKAPRGILNYTLSGHQQSDIKWKLTGNFKGEHYEDKFRGPLNEGGLYAERQGYHLPSPPVHESGWKNKSPFDGVSSSGVAFYTAPFNLSLPKNFDIPLSFNFSEPNGTHYRLQLWVNGFQYGKYDPSLGPQTEFPVPEGVLNYHGTNWVSLAIWAYTDQGAKLSSFELVNGTPVASTAIEVETLDAPRYKKRQGAY